ncbi:uncharacterized protein BDR25DRAFT_235074 [Lindgomyces ingoldianus]|uniref:Uncharacterized protein n=1 Tax=Lindgomyces ingoldianus TaxID=673940 RepID=A0ACB6QK50_9PLEO|nr:uncharacterized protein BDR25DRAFT_235074 [Lindgomyces ingoldianus]KAF2467280.1 hypothetical protein BDR25DRAFT_235074 [Lindgomyces ingoldianus]
MAYQSSPHICGCYYIDTVEDVLRRTYLPQVKLDVHTTILSTASSTVLRQTFFNPSKDKPLGEVRYTFPLFDGVSVVEFKCQIGERSIFGLVKEKGEARKQYEKTKERGGNAALLEQLPDAADVFTTSVSNIPEGSEVLITIRYIQELKHDAEVDGIRLNMPTSIAPRYGSYPSQLMESFSAYHSRGISITVDICMAEGVPIKKVISPSHPIEVSLGSLSTNTVDEEPSTSQASATLALGTAELEKDFVLQIVAKDVGIPQAILEVHPTLPNQSALMATLVPKFSLKPHKPEIIFIADRSGSMSGNVATLISALQVFLKSLPIGVMFNICSFGSSYEFLWPKSQLYGKDTLNRAMKYVSKFDANFGGTETFQAVKAAVEGRLKGITTELMLLTDGDIWSQDQMFQYIENETKDGKVRVFPIGIGGGVSSSLIEGIARAGRGFAQMVGNKEKLDGKIVRMLKGALTPHISDYHLEVKYEDDTVDSVVDSLRLKLNFEESQVEGRYPLRNKPISLYDPDSKEEHPKENEPQDIFAGLPKFGRPKILQTPHKIPPLYPFNRTCVYLLLSPEASRQVPKSVILKGTSPEGPLELEIQVEIRKEPGEMIHQLAARKATQELEEGRGWVCELKTDAGAFIKDKYPAQFALLQKREAVRLGVEFQVGGKYCSFVAIEADDAEIAEKRKNALAKTSAPSAPVMSQRQRGKATPRFSSATPSVLHTASSKKRRKIGANRFLDREAKVEEECDESDEDMGFGLFDDGPTISSATAPAIIKRQASGRGKEEKALSKEELLLRLISRQSFEGSWSREQLPCDTMGIDRDAARAAVPKLMSANTGLGEESIVIILATAIVVLFLEKKMASEEDTWELIVEKARGWLIDQIPEDALEKVWKEASILVGGA